MKTHPFEFGGRGVCLHCFEPRENHTEETPSQRSWRSAMFMAHASVKADGKRRYVRGKRGDDGVWRYHPSPWMPYEPAQPWDGE